MIITGIDPASTTGAGYVTLIGTEVECWGCVDHSTFYLSDIAVVENQWAPMPRYRIDPKTGRKVKTSMGAKQLIGLGRDAGFRLGRVHAKRYYVIDVETWRQEMLGSAFRGKAKSWIVAELREIAPGDLSGAEDDVIEAWGIAEAMRRIAESKKISKVKGLKKL